MHISTESAGTKITGQFQQDLFGTKPQLNKDVQCKGRQKSKMAATVPW